MATKTAMKQKPKTQAMAKQPPVASTKISAVVSDMAPMQMLQIAIQQGSDLEKIKTLMELERQWKADRAREAFYAAIAEFKKIPVLVTKDKVNTQYTSRYTGIGNLVNTVNPAMAPFGLNARWEFLQTDKITVKCILSHALGHSESVSLSGAPDTSGAKNPLQQIKSTVTYLEIATYQAVTGTVSSDIIVDDDGNSSGDLVSDEQAADLRARLNDVGAKEVGLCQYFKINSIDEMPSAVYSYAVSLVEAKRKKAVAKEGV